MRSEVPSLTSRLVAFARTVAGSSSPQSANWLPAGLRGLARASNRLSASAPLYRKLLQMSSLRFLDHIVLRTAAIDAQLRDALHAGARQLVIVGAGLDTRAWELPELGDVTVYEIDHPATQRYKRARTANMAARADIRYVSTDFESERFADRLRSAGFDSSAVSACIWEGVAMYLPKRSVSECIEQITEICAPESRLLMTYLETDTLPGGWLGERLTRAAFAAIGEPLKSAYSPAEMVTLLEPHWSIRYDDSARGWQRMTGSEARARPALRGERLVVAHRR